MNEWVIEGLHDSLGLQQCLLDVCLHSDHLRMFEHSGINTARLTIKNYDDGHMMYLYRPSQEALSNDIVAFIEAR